jgi:spermidine/putrescine transport system substrate-binding protein
MFMHARIRQLLFCVFLTTCLLSACKDADTPVKPSLTLAKELVFYNWEDDMPQSVLDAFTREYGVKVKSVTFESQEEATSNILNEESYDVAVIENSFIPQLVAEKRLAEIDFRHVPHFINISANFRDLALDPGNRHTVPYHYGTTGLLVRTDLIGHSVTRWTDLWAPQYAGKIAVGAQPRELLALTLLSLGYSLNSERPQELDDALNRLLQLKESVSFVEVDTPKSVSELLSGEVVMLLGRPMDYQVAHAANQAVTYVLPQEGTGLWSDNYVILANSSHKYTAEVFINFLLRPEISAQIVNEKQSANANEAALPLIKPEIRNDPVIFPSNQLLQGANFYTPLSPEGDLLYEETWERFLDGKPMLHGEE